MKYYVYVSDTKLDMLYAQIPEKRRSLLVSELKLSVKVASISLKENPGADETRYSKLQVVCDHLDNSDLVSTVDEAGPYFRGRMSLKWGSPRITGSVGVVYFTGSTNETIVGLGGSLRHVIGALSEADPDEPGRWPGSAVHGMMDWLSTADLIEGDDVPERVEDAWAWTAARLERMFSGPVEGMEFIARRLAYAEPGQATETNKAVLLGSPIYVAAVNS